MDWLDRSRSGPEWDLAAASLDRKVTLVGEVKWSSARASTDVVNEAYAALERKGAVPYAPGLVEHVLFIPQLPRRRPSGLPPSVHLVDAAMVIDALSTV